MPFELDIRTLLFLAWLLRSVQALVMVLTWMSHRSHPPARHWAVGSIVSSMGILLFALRDVLSQSWAIWLGNTLLMSGGWIFFAGVTAAAGRQPWWRAGWLMVLLGSLLTAVLCWGYPSIRWRVAVLTVVFLAAHVQAIHSCWSFKGRRAALSFKLLGAALALQIAVVGWSAAKALHEGIPSPLQGGDAIRMLLLISVLNATLVTALLVLLTSQGLQEQLENLAAHDPLTGLLNRRAFEIAAEQEWSRVRRHGRSLALLVLDADHFKRLNDTQGHAAGDRALLLMAQTLRAELRGQDLLCRYGGEEFVALLPDTSEDQAHAVAERVRESVQRMSLADDSGQPELSLTISVGVAQSQLRHKSWTEVLAEGDEAMYAAKRAGRNRSQRASQAG